MITLVSYILVIIGAFNWFSIGVLQFDFIAGIFGSQANIFSRIVYAFVGFAAIWLIYATVRQKGKIFVNNKKNNDKKLVGEIKDAVTFNKSNKKEQNVKENNSHTSNENHYNTNNNNYKINENDEDFDDSI